MDSSSLYQQMRQRNVQEKQQLLKSFGVEVPLETSLKTSYSQRSLNNTKVKGVKKTSFKKDSKFSSSKRFSLRIRFKEGPNNSEDEFEEGKAYDNLEKEYLDHEELMRNLSVPGPNISSIRRPNSYGSIKGVKVGTWWMTRLDCSHDGIHRPTVAGIHAGPDGAYSVALSGGYEDDVDLGDSFTYTGEGGRDLKGTKANPKNLRTAPQSKHQTLDRGNLALSRNVTSGNPVRVIRGYKLNSKFAPTEGYRYDGLYSITRYWETVGKAGFKIFKFDFKRCDPAPAPWSGKMLRAEVDDVDYDTFSDSISLNTSVVEPRPKRNSMKVNSEPASFQLEVDGQSESIQKENQTETCDSQRKTLYFELTKGKVSPIKVAKNVESPKECFISCEDVGYHGWDDTCEPLKSDCLTIEADGAICTVQADGDSWKVVEGSTGNEKGHHGWDNIFVLPPSNCFTVEAEGVICRVEASEDSWREVEELQQEKGHHGWDNIFVLPPSNCFTAEAEGVICRVEASEDCWREVEVLQQPLSPVPKSVSNQEELETCTALKLIFENYDVQVVWKEGKYQEIKSTILEEDNFVPKPEISKWRGWRSLPHLFRLL